MDNCRLRLTPLDCSTLATVGGVDVFLQHGFRDVDGTRDRPRLALLVLSVDLHKLAEPQISLYVGLLVVRGVGQRYCLGPSFELLKGFLGQHEYEPRHHLITVTQDAPGC